MELDELRQRMFLKEYLGEREAALKAGSVVNVAETWCRLHLMGKSGKKYIWCLVNRFVKIVIFFYDNGSRGRDALKDFLCDNSIAEQCIRPLTRERANSLHYASHKGAEVSAIYHTIFSTCKMVGISALDYLKKFFQEELKGNTDYAALLPATIGLKK